MPCIIVDGVVQGTLTIKDLEKAIRDILFKDNGIYTLPTPIGFKTVIPEENVGFICPSQIQEDINKEIINSLHSYKFFSKCLINKENL